MRRRLAVFLFLFLLLGTAKAQLSSRRCRWVKPSEAPFKLDSLTLLPSSVQFYNAGAEQLPFTYNPVTNEFTLQNATKPDSVLICYRVLPLNLGLAKQRRNPATISASDYEKPFYKEEFTVREELFSTPGLSKTGTISRGISFGNAQNVFVNSNLNLQLEGKLSDDITITGTITDQNIPFQPEGNTQQIQQFDRIYLTIEHPRWLVTAGDVVLKNKPSQFLRFYKNVQGAVAEVKSGASPEKSGLTTVALSLAKGKFASTILEPIESVQGPYKLRGPEGERFIIIMAGSERVYLDGRLLTRGFDFDYVIDYNLAEITFTPRNLIIRSSRIRVDFEYSAQNYSRSIQHLSHYQNVNKVKLQFNYYNEADNPNQPVQADLKPEQRLLLSQIGDSLNLAVVPGADSVGYRANQTLYARIDSAGFTFYRYSTNPNNAFYDVKFTEAGAGNGDYVLANSAVNGRVYKWVAPINGVHQGNYLAQRRLAAPTQKQMLTGGASYLANKYTTVYAEGAISKYDINRFSTAGSSDDRGHAFKAGYAIEGRPIAENTAYKLNSAFSYEFDEQYFKPVDRFRDIEFDRNWSLPQTTQTTSGAQSRNDNILDFSIGAVKNPEQALSYRVSRRYRRNQLSGVQHWADAAQQLGVINWRANLFVLSADRENAHSAWVRGTTGVLARFNYVQPGYTYRFDKNKVSRPNTDSLLSSAIYFEEHLFSLQSPDSQKVHFKVEHSLRQDRFFNDGELLKPQNAITTSANLSTAIGSNQTLELLATYRDLQTTDSLSERNVLSKVDYSASVLDKHLRSELSYSIATGRELKRRYEFVPQLNGQGNYYWEDLNQDGHQTLDEFFLIQQPRSDTTYIKIFTPTDEYITAFTNRFTYRLSSTMPRNWIDKPGVKGFLARFSALNFISIDKKTTDPSLANRFNPFGNQVNEELLISLNKSFRNTVYFNRSHPKYGVEATLIDNENKLLLVNGVDTRTLQEQNVNIRNNLSDVFGSRLGITRRTAASASNYLTARNFILKGYEVTPELSWQPVASFRLTTTYLFSKRQNIAPNSGGERLQSNELGIETRLSQVSKRTVTANVRYIKIAYKGEVNSVVGNELLNALRPGNNLTWMLNVQQRLSNGLNITLSYDGRNASGSRTVHIGRMQVSVLF